MTILVVSTWVVKPEKQEEFMQLWQRHLKYRKENPEMFKELKSFKLFTQTFGGISGAYVELVEYNSLADYEKLIAKISKDKGFMKMLQEFILLIDPDTLSENVWNAIT